MSTAGWYGKLPSLGDFASRRLEASFITPWDEWLAEGLDGLRTHQPSAWLDAYLASPVWRFVLMPGTMGLDQAMAGVLMPSVDRVGRYFPLTLTATLPTPPQSEADIQTLLTWLHQLDDLAADALHDDWGIDQLEDQLSKLAMPGSGALGNRSSPSTSTAVQALSHVMQGSSGLASLPVSNRMDLSALLSHSAAAQWLMASQGLSFWWAESAHEPPRAFVARGLPRGDGFAMLLGHPAT